MYEFSRPVETICMLQYREVVNDFWWYNEKPIVNFIFDTSSLLLSLWLFTSLIVSHIIIWRNNLLDD